VPAGPKRRPPVTVRLTVGLGVHSLPKEATVFISIDYSEERFEASDFRVGLVSVPFEISAHPKYTPTICCPHKRCLRDRVLHHFLWIVPMGTDLEDLHALASNPVSDVELRPNVRWRPATLQELCEVALAAHPLEIGQRHKLPPESDAQQ